MRRDLRVTAGDPVVQRPMAGRKRDPVPRDRIGRKAWISSASGFSRYAPPTTRASKAITTTAAFEPRVEPDDLARLDDQAGLLERLADGRLGHRLVDYRESRPAAPTRRGRVRCPDAGALAGQAAPI